MNRKQLLAQLKKLCAYDGPEDIAAIKTFIKDNGITIEGDLDATWANTKTVTISVTADAGEEVRVQDGSTPEGEAVPGKEDEDANKPKSVRADKPAAKSGNKATRVESTLAMTPKMHAGLARRKAYNVKAAKGQTVYADADMAESAGAWFRSVVLRDIDYDHKAADLEILGKTMVTTNNTLGGALVPEDFEATLIDLKEERGAARAGVGVTPMSRDTLMVPRETGGVTVYAPGEAGSITASDLAYDNVNLTAFKMAALSTISSELANDAAVNVADRISKRIAYGFADKEDECFFNGDGTGTYFAVGGVRNALLSLSATRANIAGLTVGAGNLWSELTLPNFQDVVGNLPAYAEKGAAWYCHKRFWATIMRRLSTAPGPSGAVGGVTAAEIQEGGSYTFEGYPVKFVQCMPRVEANDVVPCLFGNLGMGSKFGEVRGSMSIVPSSERYFEQDIVAIRGIQRIAINVHDVGNASGTASLRIPGPIVGLLTAAS